MRSWIGERPDHAGAHRLLGFLLQAGGDADGAEKEYRESLRVDPNELESAVRLVGLLLSRGRGDEAVAALRELLARVERPAEVRLLLARVLLLGDPASGEAIEILEEAREEGFRMAAAGIHCRLLELRALFAAGRLEDAEEAAGEFGRRVAEGGLADQAKLVGEGWCLAAAVAHRAGDLALARLRYLRAIDVWPGCHLAMNNLASLLLEGTHRWADAVEDALLYARRAVELRPSFPPYLDTLETALRAAGRTAEADALRKK